ncbi:MAG: succinate dehydrogenase / fumarate reductase cytochrome b subunit [Alphaproteobacteria bacterium]|jgi:succinate dehydrogenase / fumarate reductase cytochrome b subunit
MSDNKSQSAASKRPMSPHLQIYKPQITSIMSILHRITGVSLTFGLLMFLWFVGALATGPEAFDTFTSVSGSFLGIIAIFGFIVALSYHLCNGIRHLFWDLGFGYDIEIVTKSGYGVLIATGILSLFVVITILI